MSVKREIKCPHCKEWTLWRGNLHDRCLYCGEFLQNEAFTKKVEKEIREQVTEEKDFLFVKPGDGKAKAALKRFLRPIRNFLYYVQFGFFAFVSMILWLIGLLAT